MAQSSSTTVGSVARALDLVELVVGGPDVGLPLSEIAKAVGGSKSAVLATLRTLSDWVSPYSGAWPQISARNDVDSSW